MRINNYCFLSFQKILSARASIKENGKTSHVFIYELNEKFDIKDLESLAKNQDWDSAYYKGDVLYEFRKHKDEYNFYTMENSSNEIIGYCQTSKDNSVLKYIEAMPKLSKYSETRKAKFIGETLIAFLIKKCRKEKNIKYFKVPTVASRPKTNEFYYNQCHMQKFGTWGASLKNDKFSELIKQNEDHTGGVINLCV